MGLAHIAIAGLAGLSVILSLWALRRDSPPVWRFAMPAPVAMTPGAARIETLFDYAIETGQAHSPTIVMGEGGFDVLWFEGSAEAQADVDIHHAAFRQFPEGWQTVAHGPRMTRAGLGKAMDPHQLVVTLGNTVENEARPGGVFATVVSVGGWAMASVADVTLGEAGPQAARKLNLSPFLNRSHLVKSPMVAFEDGSFGLPAYFEMGAAHGVLVRFDARGRVRDTARMAGAGKPIQPMIVPLDQGHAVAFLRDFEPSGRLLVSRTADGGRYWSPVAPTDLPNPSAPVAALNLGDGQILMAANDDPAGGDRLSLLMSQDGGESWRVLEVLEENGAGARYPVLRAQPGGGLILAYSVGNKTGLRVRLLQGDWSRA
ncbi:exo-alpha-sialidase [Roseovarius aestuariivivens]|uniref:exo-alpha-sialidase n=1 Tax=Roseovarius aestuariivivens TaxID=1888910 RepID=UPI001081B0F9|nr:exo-alpha-sialidase [Roseovarius aestuariivivens]